MIKENFLVFCITIFPEKAQNKIKQSPDQDDFVLMMTIHKAKSHTQVHIRLGRDKRIFEKQQTTNILNGQMSSRKNIDSDSIAATRSDSNF